MTADALARLLSERLEWQEDAVCAQTDPEAFFPEKGGSTRDAKMVCLGCPVQDQCLQYALDNQERFGIWGGLSERERRKLQDRVGQGHGRILSEAQEQRAMDMLDRGLTVTQVARQFAVNFSVIRRLRGIYEVMNGKAA
jgi:WhiB family redox-sensing transcriptional regulator